MTLKLMGLAFEVHDSKKMAKNGDDQSLEKKYKHVDPAVVDIFHYAFAHSGILTGLCFALSLKRYLDRFEIF